MKPTYKKYLMFWASQTASQLGSAMTSYALILWVYTAERSAMAVSLMTFCSYVPYVLASLFAGGFVDAHSKKKVMLLADSAAAACTAGVLALYGLGRLEVGHIYLANLVTGLMNAFQAPAASVVTGQLAPEGELARVSGLNSFSTSLTMVLAPVLASSLFAWGGLQWVLWVDLASFAAASLLLFGISVPEAKGGASKEAAPLAGCGEGLAFLRRERGLLTVVLTLALLNFFSRLTYENILSPMLLARSGGSSFVLGAVNAVMGVGGILGGVLVSARKTLRDPVRAIYAAAGASFLLGDLLMALGRGSPVWALAALAASLPMPFIFAGQNLLLYQRTPQAMQGRVFAVRNAIQYSTIPAGILLGGFLADYVFEPFMAAGSPAALCLQRLVGAGTGSGMAVMFLCTGVLGSASSALLFRSRVVQALRQDARQAR